MENILAQASVIVPNFFASATSILPQGSGKLILIFGGTFLFLLMMGWARHHQLLWTFKGAHFGVLFGIVLTLVIEALIIVGGKTTLAEIIKSDKTPPVVREVISKNLQELTINLMGAPKSTEAKTLGSTSKASTLDIVGSYQELSKSDQSRVKDLICIPR